MHSTSCAGTPDDLDGEPVDVRDGGRQFLPGIAAIGEEVDERGIFRRHFARTIHDHDT